MSTTNAAIKRDARKGDLYVYIATIKNKKTKEIHEKYGSEMDKISASLQYRFNEESKAIVNAIENLEQKYNELTTKLGSSGLITYNVRVVMDRINFNLKSHYRDEIAVDVIDKFTLSNHSAYKVYDTDSEIVRRAKSESNKINVKYKEELAEVTKLHRELQSIIKNASRGSDAWTKLEEVGLNLKPLEAKLMQSGNFLPVAVKTSVDISLFNKVAMEPAKNKDSVEGEK